MTFKFKFFIIIYKLHISEVISLQKCINYKRLNRQFKYNNIYIVILSYLACIQIHFIVGNKIDYFGVLIFVDCLIIIVLVSL